MFGFHRRCLTRERKITTRLLVTPDLPSAAQVTLTPFFRMNSRTCPVLPTIWSLFDPPYQEGKVHNHPWHRPLLQHQPHTESLNGSFSEVKASIRKPSFIPSYWKRAGQILHSAAPLQGNIALSPPSNHRTSQKQGHDSPAAGTGWSSSDTSEKEEKDGRREH